MRKFFTFVICALVAVSVWGAGTEVTIDDGNNGSSDQTEFAPFRSYNKYGLSQIIYLKSELSDAEAGNITSISFKFASSKAISRNLDIYMSNTSATKFSAFVSVTAAQKVFSGSVSTLASDWYTITLQTPFAWDGESNILVTIDDNTGSFTQQETKHYKNNFNALVKRLVYYSNDSKNLDPTNPTESGTISYLIPKVKFIIEAGSTPVTTPTITVSGAELDFGSYYPAAETVSQTFKVTASDLTNDITLTTNASAGVTISPSEIAKDNTDLAVDGVAVTVTLSKGYPFPITNPTVTIASEGATSKSVTIKATEGSFSSLSTMESLNTNGYFLLDFDATISSINSEEKTMTIKKVSTKNANYALIDGIETFAVGGKFSGLKGKYENEVFKIFSYTNYTAPAPTSVVEVDEDFDHSADWADIEDGENVSTLTIKRTIVPNEWNSIVLPTYLTSTEVSDYFGAGTDVEAFSGAVVTSSRVTLNFTPKTDGIEAGVPYLIKPKQALPNPLNLTNHSFKKTVSPDTYDGIEFVGVLVPTDIDGSGDDYIIVGSGNTLLHPSGAGTIKGMRAYFHVVGPAAKAAIRKSPTISLSTGSTTAMTLVKPDAGKAYKAIENGRIVIKANGKKVNVLGQTVK